MTQELMSIKVGDRLLMVGRTSVSVEEVTRVTQAMCSTKCVDVNIRFTRESELRQWMLAQPTARLRKDRIETFVTPATINLSGNGEYVVIGVYYRP